MGDARFHADIRAWKIDDKLTNPIDYLRAGGVHRASIQLARETPWRTVLENPVMQ